MKQQSEICKARSLFTTRGILNREIIPDDIVYSWVRSKLHNISFELLDLKENKKAIDILSLDKNASQVIQVLRKYTLDKSIIYLIDQGGNVIYESDKNGFVLPSIISFSEEIIGTTAVGISLLTGKNASVYGCEHYNQMMTNYATESIVIEGNGGSNTLIICILTPILHYNAHQRLKTQFESLFLKEEEKLAEPIKNVDIAVEIPVNPVKTPVKTVEKPIVDIIPETTGLNDCKQFTLRVIEEQTIRDAISHYNWNLKRTSEALGIGRSTLYRKIKEYNIKE